MVKINRMNTRSNKELLFGHAILHGWAKNNFRRRPPAWSKSRIVREHARLARIMRKRRIRHTSPLRLKKTNR